MNSKRRGWNRLGVKLAAPIALVALATIGVFAIISIRAQKEHVIGEAVRAAALLSETVKSSIYHHMLADQRADAYQIMDSIGGQDGIEGVRMFDKDGRITFSTLHEEIGRAADRSSPACTACHAHGHHPIAGPTTSRIYDDADGHRVLGVVTPVYNESSCYNAACHAHAASQRVLGIVDVSLSLKQIDASANALTRSTMLLSAAAVLLLAGLVLFFVQRSVLRPVGDLVRGTRWIAERDLEHEIPIRSPDELGQLAASFNEMTSSLRQTRGELRALMQSLEKQVEDRTAALQKAQDQLVQSEKMSSLGKLSASIAHEINNPLMGILTMAKLLVRTLEESPHQGTARGAAFGRLTRLEPALDDTARATSLKQLKMVQRETERCTAIVRNLLDFARQRPLTLKAIDLNLAIEEALSVAGNQMAIQQIAIEKRLGPLPTVQADLGQLRQAFLNVVLNACEAMPQGGSLKVSSRFDVAGRCAVAEVADTGGGISPEHRQRIFDPFFTTKEKGTGLGLSVVYGIVQRHGGSIDVRSEMGQGTTIAIAVPVATPSDEKAA
jgi:two-component system NtrC family sensor kinase